MYVARALPGRATRTEPFSPEPELMFMHEMNANKNAGKIEKINFFIRFLLGQGFPCRCAGMTVFLSVNAITLSLSGLTR